MQQFHVHVHVFYMYFIHFDQALEHIHGASVFDKHLIELLTLCLM